MPEFLIPYAMIAQANSPGEQFVWLLILGIPVACVSWTVTHEEVFREAREWFRDRSKHAPKIYQRKFFYLLTCEYCFSHYIAAAFIVLCNFRLLVPGWARVPDRVAEFGVDCERLYEFVRQAPSGHQARTYCRRF